MFLLTEEFKAGMKIFQIPLKWYRKVTAFLNHFIGTNGISVKCPPEPSGSDPVEIGLDKEWLDSYIKGQFSAGNRISATDLAQGTIAVDDSDLQTTLSAGTLISAADLAQGTIAIDVDELVTGLDELYCPVLEKTGNAAPVETGNYIVTPSTTSDVSKEQTTWTAGTTELAIKVYTRIIRRKDFDSGSPNSIYAYAFYRTFTFNPNGTLKSVSAEQGFYVLAIT